MSATIEGDGAWGISAAEPGFIINGLDDTSRADIEPLKNHQGEDVGQSFYNESIEIELEAAVTTDTPFTGKLNAELSLTNAVSLAHINEVGPGKTLTREVRRTRQSEAWNGISVRADVKPYFAAA